MGKMMDAEHAQRVIKALIRMKRENMKAMGQMMAENREKMVVDPADSDYEVLQALIIADAAIGATTPGPSETRPKRKFSFRPRPKKV